MKNLSLSTIALLIGTCATTVSTPSFATEDRKQPAATAAKPSSTSGKATTSSTAGKSTSTSSSTSGATTTPTPTDPRATAGGSDRGTTGGHGVGVVNPGIPRIPGDLPAPGTVQKAVPKK
jgi:hypothetical protein